MSSGSFAGCNCRGQAGRHQHIQQGRFMANGTSDFGISLNSFIDSDKIAAWNVREPPAAVAAMVDIAQSTELHSDADEEMLFHFPFTEFVKIRAVSIIGGGGGFSPSEVALYTNTTRMAGFDDANGTKVQQTIQLVDTSDDDEILYVLEAVKFMSVGNLTLFVKHSFDGDETRLRRVVFYGESTKMETKPQLATNVVYELRANPADHRDDGAAEPKKEGNGLIR
jgi:hypothetical protein